MKVVIEIPEEMYKHILSMQFFIPGLRSGKSFLNEILKAIRMGTPLPKHHGRLIDADKLIRDTIKNPVHPPYIHIIDMKDAPTIIEGSEVNERKTENKEAEKR